MERSKVFCVLAVVFCLMTGCARQEPLSAASLIPKETVPTYTTVTTTVAPTTTEDAEETTVTTDTTTPTTTLLQESIIILNTSSKRFHINPQCSAVKQMDPKNYAERPGDQVEIVMQEGYTPCGICAKQYK